MHAEQRVRADKTLTAHHLRRALFANPFSVTWLTGLAPPPQLGPLPFAGGPSLVWYEDGEFVLIVVDAYADQAAASGCRVHSYLGYTSEQPLASSAHLAETLSRVVGSASVGIDPVGVEEGSLPVALYNILRAALHNDAEVTPIDGWLTSLQVVKTDEELVKLRENFALTDIGHGAARRAVQAGQREIDVWVEIESAIQHAAGQRVPVGNDCVVGYRQNNSGGWPLDLEIRPHDSVIVDLSTLRYGYWSDSCATYYAGEPTRLQQEMHCTVAAALDFAISLVKPGAVCSEIDRAVRQFIADAGYPIYPHHTGHSVGVTGHADPRIVPYNNQVVEAGMVLMLEPGIYYPGITGVRLEDAVLVTATGAEVLTYHDKAAP